MLRGETPPTFQSPPDALLARPFSCRVLLSPRTFLTGHFYRQAIALGAPSATLFGMVSRCVPRSIAEVGQTVCVDACASVLD